MDKKKILIVDDDVHIGNMLQELLIRQRTQKFFARFGTARPYVARP